jgi:hypothetical protein
MMVPCCSIACLLSIFFVKQHSLRREDDEKRKQEGKEWMEKHKEKKTHGLKGKKKDSHPAENGAKVQPEKATVDPSREDKSLEKETK